jgi:hypothetical protein
VFYVCFKMKQLILIKCLQQKEIKLKIFEFII